MGRLRIKRPIPLKSCGKRAPKRCEAVLRGLSRKGMRIGRSTSSSSEPPYPSLSILEAMDTREV
jgi:hypothetical protein